MCLICLASLAQKKVTVKAGTIIPITTTNLIAAAKVKVGDRVNFIVSRDININGETVIPYGTPIQGKVEVAKRSSWWGTRGRLSINISELMVPYGDIIPLKNGQIEIKGKNRTALSVILFAFVVWPACFICGSKAEIQPGYAIQTYVSTDTDIYVQ